MDSRASQLALGMRFALVGGTSARLRVALTAGGVALAAAALLVAACVPGLVHAHHKRETAWDPVYAKHGDLRALQTRTEFHGVEVEGLEVQPTGSLPAMPPGVQRLPGPGEMLVSPALRSLLQGPRGGELRRRLDARVMGTISDAGLVAPDDARFIRGDDHLASLGLGGEVSGFGAPPTPETLSPALTLLLISMLVALLLPVAVFLSTAARFGSEERDRRLSALRLLGADARATSLMAAGEALVGGIAGLLLGGGVFMAIRPLTQNITIAGISMFAGDVWPSPILAAATVALVLGCVVVASLLGMRRVAIEPLGVSRRGRSARRRLHWRIATPLLGFLLLAPFAIRHTELTSAAQEAEAAGGIVLVLVGIMALLPWAVEAIVRSAGDGPLQWLLAIRRLRSDEGTTGRVVGAVGLAVAGAIALQMLFAGAENRVAEHGHTRAELNTASVAVHAPSDRSAAIVAQLRGVHGVIGVSDVNSRQGITSADVRTRAGDDQAVERLRDRAARIDTLALVTPMVQEGGAERLLGYLRRSLLAGAFAVLLMMGGSLLVGAAEQLRERRRVLSVLAAFGTRRSTMAWSLLWQSAIPVAAGLLLATALGSLLGLVLMRMVGLPAAEDWGSVGALVAAGAGVIVAITLVTLPLLWRLMTPDALRAE